MVFTHLIFKAPADTHIVPIEIILIDANATLFGTFQSYNQKVVSNQNGIFMTHVRSRNDDYTAQHWRLSRSTDGGLSFYTLYEATHATNPPVLETDSQDNIYLMRADFTNNNAYLYRFLAEDNYVNPLISTVSGVGADKYSMVLDEQAGLLYFFSKYDRFSVLSLDGTLQRSVRLHRSGQYAGLVYPLLSLAPDGILHLAWTTQKHDFYLYWDIHHMLTPDRGLSWMNLNNTPLSLGFRGIVADNSGPTLRITLDDEFETHTWLSSFIVKQRKIHFAYRAEGLRQHHVRYDIVTGIRDVDHQELRGETINLNNLDGFFASDAARPSSPLYYVSLDVDRLACLVSLDNGLTWHDHARANTPRAGTYAIGGCRQLTADGYIIGSFTATGYNPERVYFFRIPAADSPLTIQNFSHYE